MFRASLCPSSGAYQMQQQPLVYHRNVVVAVLLVVVGPERTDHDLSRRAGTGRSPAEILGANPTGGMDICLL